MRLFFRDLGGEGPPIVIMHGLFGSSKNWISTGRFLRSYGHAYALDLRNHGDSPHSGSHTLFDLMGDCAEWIESHLSEKPVLLGHSMGGMACMGYAMEFSESVKGVIVVDIAPKEYNNDHSREIQALKLDLSMCRNRQEIDALMSKLIPNASIRKFLQMSLGRRDNTYVWKINVDALEGANVSADFCKLQGTYSGKTAFLLGARSPYVTKKDHGLIRRYFPNALIRAIPAADHWLHHTAADEFRKELEAYFTK